MAMTKKIKQVLIIEDEKDLRQFSAWLLEAEGFKVIQAADGDEGLNAARQYKPDLVLLDIRMPESYGWEVLEEIKNTPELAHIPTVIFTASADISYKSKAMQMGAADYLVKPISAETLMECVTRVIKQG
jgi:DNA-binding response OmpR family regulator